MSYMESVDFGNKPQGHSGTIYIRSVPSGVALGICIDLNGDLDIAFDATEAGKLIDALGQCRPGPGEATTELCCWDHESDGNVLITIHCANDQIELRLVPEGDDDYVWRIPMNVQETKMLARALAASLGEPS
jgi:hypothetical protein